MNRVPPLRDRVAVVQMAMGAYRQRFLDHVEASGRPFDFYVGDEHFGRGLTTDVDSRLVRRTGRNVFLAGRRLGFQRVSPARLARYGHVVVEINPRNLSTWATLLVRAALRRPTSGWGHAGAREEKGVGPAVLARHAMQGLCSTLIMYTASEAEAVRRRFPAKSVVVASNAVYSRREMRPARREEPGARDLIWIGRVVPDKKPLLAVEAMRELVRSGAGGTRLHLVGEGPLLDEVRARIAEYGLGDVVLVYGKVTDPAELARLFGRCAALLATGYVGLNVTQSLGFGVPVIYPDADPHAPEIEALDARNGVSFPSDDAAGCAAAIGAVLSGAVDLASREEISEAAAGAYSVEAMSGAFVDLATRVPAPRGVPVSAR